MPGIARAVGHLKELKIQGQQAEPTEFLPPARGELKCHFRMVAGAWLVCSMIGALAHTPRGHGFDSQTQPGHVWEAAN